MRIQDLIVLHQTKAGAGSALSGFADARFFTIETCQRVLAMGLGAQVEELSIWSAQSVEVFKGERAYGFLLRFACGLASEVRGETEVLGQLKQAWLQFADAPLKRELQPWINHLFEDTKEIRAQYLHGTGGTSYGSLVRRLHRARSTGAHEKILLIGAGHLASTVAPWLSEHELWVWNRTRSASERLAQEVSAKARLEGRAASVVVLDPSDLDEERRAWREASHVVVCVPEDSARDEMRLLCFKEGELSAGARSVIHLGVSAKDAGAWSELPHFACLDDVFELQRQLDANRTEVFASAEHACTLRAKLRCLPGSEKGSLSVSHGWEDLAIFS
jgi:hypothetical protein